MVLGHFWRDTSIVHILCYHVHVFVLVSMLGRGTIGNKFWIMDQPSLRQGQHRAIVLLRQDADDDNAISCMLLLLHPGYLKTILF